MTTLLLILAGWVLLSLPLALIVARMFRPLGGPPSARPRAARVARRTVVARLARSLRPMWVGRANPAHVGQDGARAATGSRSAH